MDNCAIQIRKQKIFRKEVRFIMFCPICKSERIVKNGSIHNGKQKFMCRECGRQFVGEPENRIISQKTKELIDRLLPEKISLAGIARVAGVSERWLQDYVNKKYEEVPRKVAVRKKRV